MNFLISEYYWTWLRGIQPTVWKTSKHEFEPGSLTLCANALQLSYLDDIKLSTSHFYLLANLQLQYTMECFHEPPTLDQTRNERESSMDEIELDIDLDPLKRFQYFLSACVKSFVSSWPFVSLCYISATCPKMDSISQRALTDNFIVF